MSASSGHGCLKFPHGTLKLIFQGVVEINKTKGFKFPYIVNIIICSCWLEIGINWKIHLKCLWGEKGRDSNKDHSKIDIKCTHWINVLYHVYLHGIFCPQGWWSGRSTWILDLTDPFPSNTTSMCSTWSRSCSVSLNALLSTLPLYIFDL